MLICKDMKISKLYDPNFSFDKKGEVGANKIQWPDDNRGGSKPSNDKILMIMMYLLYLYNQKFKIFNNK